MRKLKVLPPSHLDRLINAGKPIYVLNTSALTTGDKGMIVVNFFDGTRRDFFKMPPTFIPMAVSDAIPSNKLKESRDFKQCLLKGMLTLVEPASAEDYLSTGDAQDEYESLVLSEHSAQFNNIDVEKEVSRRTRVAHQTGGGAGPIQDVSAVDTISNKVRGVVESMVSGTMSPKEALTQLRRHQSALKSVDFSYVVENSADVDLTHWAKKALVRASQDDMGEFEEPKPKKKRAVATKPRKKAVKTETSAFDYGSDNDVMTPEERAADDQARSEAFSTQSTQGQSKINEIDEIMKR